jgi:phosphohistidine phosphatase
MKVYLIRHGQAGDPWGRNDGERPLTDEGRAETKIVGQALKRLGVSPDVFISSPLVRARQTAEIIADAFGYKGNSINICQALAPGVSASAVYKDLKEFTKANQVCLFGHEPDMGHLAATLLLADGELYIPFKKSAVCRIDITSVPPTTQGILKWFITPKIARAIMEN